MALWLSPSLTDGEVSLRMLTRRDGAALDVELGINRAWLQPWEATDPSGWFRPSGKALVRSLLQGYREGTIVPWVIEVGGEVAGQLNLSGVTAGSLSSASIGYWVAERFAGRGVTPTAVALATDHAFSSIGLHRIEICIRPENVASLRVVQKLGFRYEGRRRRYIHIDGDWRDHVCFALVREDVPIGVLARWRSGLVPADAAMVPPEEMPPAS